MRASRAALVALLAVTLAGCSGTATPLATPSSFDLGAVALDDLDRNGLEYLAGADALEQVLSAARTAGTVTVTGTYDELLPPPEGEREPVPGLAISIDWSGDSGDFLASVTAGELAGDIRASGSTAVARGNAAFSDAHGIAVSDEWACLDGGASALEQWEPLLDPIDLIETLLEAREGSEIVVSTGAVVNDTIELAISSGSGAIGTLVVSALGPPLPVTLIGGDASGTGTFAFDDWGAATDLEPVESLARCD